MNLSKTWRNALCGALVACAAGMAAAWTDKPVKIVVPAPPGGVFDVVARVVAEQLSKDIGQPVIVDNKPGAGGGIGIQAMLAAPADGNTLMVAADNILTEVPHVLKTSFDPLKDVKPLFSFARVRFLLVSGTAVPAQDFSQLLAHLKSGRGKYSYASHSTGTMSHLQGLILSNDYDLDLAHVPFAGAAPALQQLMGGQVTIMFDSMVTSPPLVASGKLRAYAVSGTTRHPLLPNVPTFAEAGRPDLDFGNWYAVHGSAKLPGALAERIAQAVAKAVAAPAVRDKLVSLGYDMTPPQTTAALVQLLRADYERNGAIVKKFDVKL